MSDLPSSCFCTSFPVEILQLFAARDDVRFDAGLDEPIPIRIIYIDSVHERVYWVPQDMAHWNLFEDMLCIPTDNILKKRDSLD